MEAYPVFTIRSGLVFEGAQVNSLMNESGRGRPKTGIVVGGSLNHPEGVLSVKMTKGQRSSWREGNGLLKFASVGRRGRDPVLSWHDEATSNKKVIIIALRIRYVDDTIEDEGGIVGGSGSIVTLVARDDPFFVRWPLGWNRYVFNDEGTVRVLN